MEKALDAHLFECSECRERLELLQALADAFENDSEHGLDPKIPK
jgi:hypothetical protein